MSNNTAKEKEFAKIPQLSLRAILAGMFGSCIITASFMYVALRISALPWPTIFVAVLSMALLKALRETTLNEINITQTAMSAGAMVAGGLAFTLPGLWITGLWNSTTITSGHFWKVLAIALAGMILGTLLTWFLRPRFVEKEALPYPIGAAAAETIITGDSGGKKSAVLFGTMAFSAVFTFLRDSLGWIPSALSSKWLYSKNFFVGVWVSPMAVGIGYMIGTLYTRVWFLGAVLSYLLIIPLGPVLGLFPSAEAAAGFKNTAGIGLMVGTGAGILISYIFSLVKKLVAGKWAKKATVEKLSKRTFSLSRLLTILSVAVAFALSIACGLGVLPSLLLIAGVFVVSAMAAIITGQVLDTNPLAQLISQFIGGVAGTVVAAAAMFAIIAQFGGVGPDKGLPAGQAFAVSQMVNGIGQPLVFGIAVLIGAVLYLLKVPAMTLGIGMYLPFEISSVVFIGGLTRLISSRLHPKSGETGNIAASGLLGGEGVTGVAVAIIKMITGG